MSTTQQLLPEKEVTTFAYALCHFVVDFACVSTMLCSVSRVLGESGQDSLELVALSILLYDVVAFALQLPVGVALDKLDKNSTAALLSYMLIGGGVLLSCSIYSMVSSFIACFWKCTFPLCRRSLRT